jgi:protein gp37
MLPPDWGEAGYPNVWLGTTTEDEKHYRMRWPMLARIPAVVHFISYEPAIGSLGRLGLKGLHGARLRAALASGDDPIGERTQADCYHKCPIV